jgi:hypothetical protein
MPTGGAGGAGGSSSPPDSPSGNTGDSADTTKPNDSSEPPTGGNSPSSSSPAGNASPGNQEPGPETNPTNGAAPNTEPTQTSMPNASGEPNPPEGNGGAAPTDPEPPNPPAEQVVCETVEEETFSFFVISYEGIRTQSGSDEGFGGDLGGISGADAICQRVAESSSSCASNRVWRAFLSTTTEDAIDRIGEGPWLDRIGRLLAANKEDLLTDRPTGADPEIADDFPNEFGVPNRYPAGDNVEEDNHQTLTGSGADGRLYSSPASDAADGGAAPGGGFGGGGFGGGGFGGGAVVDAAGEPLEGTGPDQCAGGWTPEKATCWDWTSSEPDGCPRVGHSWPGGSGVNWISVWNEGGCAAGINLVQNGGLTGLRTVGSAGGYGGFYCFAE